MNEDIIAAIDCGTQSVRVLLFNHIGSLVAFEKVGIEPYFSVRPGWAEQDPYVYENAIIEACHKLRTRAPKIWEQVKGIVLTTQRDTCVLVDKKGEVLRPAILWLDQRMAKSPSRIPFIYDLGFRLVGELETAKISQKKSKAYWIKENEPEVWKKIYKFLLLSGWLNYRLTGRMADSRGSQIGHIPLNYKIRDWPKSKHDYRWYVFGIDYDKLPELVEPGEVIGYITSDAAERTGFRAGTPVFAGASDKGCETLGTGCLDPSSACVSLGTTVTLQVTSPKYLEPLKFMPSYPAAIPGFYNPEVEIFRGFWMVTWFKKEFGHYEAEVAQKQGVPVEEVLNEFLKSTPAGSMGLLLQPYWGAGLKTPEARGAIVGFGDVHTRAHMYRSIIEGISYALRDAAEKIEKVSHIPIRTVAASGGGSSSDSICQILADVMDKPVLKVHTSEGSGLGAAIIGFYALGVYGSFREAVEKMVRYEKRFEPNPKNVTIYTDLYNGVYKRLYKSLKPLYKEMRRITGYPEY
jgi:sugar (pentulose or hexulose) kinase